MYSKDYILGDDVSEAIQESYGKSGVQDPHQRLADMLSISRVEAKELYWQWLYTPEVHYFKKRIIEQGDTIKSLIKALSIASGKDTKELFEKYL